MSTPLRFGLLGCADIARRRVLPAMAKLPNARLVAVASRDSAKAARTARHFGAEPVDGYDRLLRSTNVDAVYIPLPAALHAEWAAAALRAGKHVLVEKPLTTDAVRTAGLVRLAADLQLGLMENVMFLHHRQHEEVRRLIAASEIGDLRAFSASFAVPARPDGDIRLDPALGGGALLDVGLYPLRAAQHLLGSDLDVLGAQLVRLPSRRVETSGAALLSAPHGVMVQLTFGMDHHYASRYELWGSDGRITVDQAFTPPADRRPTVRLMRGADVRDLVIEPDDQVTNTLTTFIQSVRAGSGAAYRHEATLRQAELLDAVRRCAARK